VKGLEITQSKINEKRRTQPNEEIMKKLEQSSATGVKVVKQRHKTA